MDVVARIEAALLDLDRIKDELLALKAFEEARDIIVPATKPELSHPLATQLRIDANEAWDTTNIYGLEYDPLGLPFRWTGPVSPTTWNVWIDRNRPLRINVRIVSLGQTAPTPLRAGIDGHELELSPTSANSQIYTAGPFPETDRIGESRIMIHVSKVFQVDGDIRKLGIAIAWLEILPDEA